MVVIGAIMGAFGPSLMMLPLGGLSPFGPQKSFVLYLSAAIVMAGLALDRAALVCAWDNARRSRVAWAIVAMTGLAILSTVTALDRWQALLGGFPDYRGLISVLAYAAVGLGCVAVCSSANGLRLIARSSVVAVTVVSLIGALQYMAWLPGGPSGNPAWRIASTLGNSSNLGVFAVLLVPLIAWVALRDEARTWRVLASIAVLASLALLVGTQSRGGWLGIAAAAALAAASLLLLRVGRGRFNSRAVVLAALAAASLVAMWLASPRLGNRAQTLLDGSSRTARWRLSAWDSALDMVLARPFLGYGPDNFRYGYPRFQAPGQIDGRWGYQVVEAAHNLVLDSGAAFGALGVVSLFAIVIFTAWALVKIARADDRDRGVAIALASSLAGGFVALQFHYITMDTGALLAGLLACVVVQEARHLPASTPAPAPIRANALLGTMSAVFALLALGSGAVVIADAMVGRAISAAENGAPWERVHPVLERATSLAAWEPQVRRANATAATAVLIRTFDPEAARDGLGEMTTVTAARPLDVVLAAERANLTLAAGLAAQDRALLEGAMTEFAVVEELDPNTGIATAGKATALLALGRVDESIASYERALRLSPRYKLGWTNAAKAYERAGRNADAKQARQRAKRL